jgi:hypothetical protein
LFPPLLLRPQNPESFHMAKPIRPTRNPTITKWQFDWVEAYSTDGREASNSSWTVVYSSRPIVCEMKNIMVLGKNGGLCIWSKFFANHRCYSWCSCLWIIWRWRKCIVSFSWMIQRL